MLLAEKVLLVVLLLGLAVSHSNSQECGETNVRSRGAAGNGRQNDSQFFRAMDGDPAAGLIYMSDGTYRISESLVINKPIMGSEKAVFLVDAGCVLMLVNQPEHPLTTFFRGAGKVVLGEGAVRSYPEWWGAKGNGRADDSAAVRNAFYAAAETGNAMLYLTKNYGLGSELQLTNRATVFAQPSARFVSVKGNPRGLTFLKGGYGFKMELPHFSGFSEFCLRLLGSDLAAMQLKTLSNCGDAIVLEATLGDDVNMVLDNTLWFDTITNSRIAIAFRANPGCIGPACVYQGNHFVGNAIRGGPSTGESSAFAFLSPESEFPAWDSNQFDIAVVTPPSSNPQYALSRAIPEAHRAVVKIARLDALPPGAKLFSAGIQHRLQVTINLGAQLGEGQLGLNGLLNLVTMTGATNPLPNTPPVRCVTQQGDQAGFNGGRSLVGNFFNLLAMPEKDWAAGEVLQFYIYHQLALGDLYQIKCGAPKGAEGLPTLDCVQFADNSRGNPGVPATPNEIQLYLINLTGGTIQAGTEAPFSISVGTLANPQV